MFMRAPIHELLLLLASPAPSPPAAAVRVVVDVGPPPIALGRERLFHWPLLLLLTSQEQLLTDGLELVGVGSRSVGVMEPCIKSSWLWSMEPMPDVLEAVE